jgi:acyl dehydratase
MRTVYFEDLETGGEYIGPECVVDKKEMLEYNRKNDPWPIHIDEAASRQSPFDDLIASGGFTITLNYRLSHGVYNTPEARWAFLGGFDWHVKFPAPVRAGDTLRYRLTVLGKKPSSKPGRGVVTARSQLTNQRGEVVLEIEAVFLVATRPRGDL